MLSLFAIGAGYAALVATCGPAGIACIVAHLFIMLGGLLPRKSPRKR